MKRIIFISLLLNISVLYASAGVVIKKRKPAVLTGTIMSNDYKPLANAIVTYTYPTGNGNNQTTIHPDQNGNFVVDIKLDPNYFVIGKHNVIISCVGYKSVEFTVIDYDMKVKISLEKNSSNSNVESHWYEVLDSIEISSEDKKQAQSDFDGAIAWSQWDWNKKPDFSYAAWLFHSAAKKGHVGAQEQLGMVYNMGRGVNKDNSKAAFWFGKAAEHGNSNAQRDLALLYLEGYGVEKDIKKAKYLLHQSALQGNEYAQSDLGSLYSGWYGGAVDYKKAAEWYFRSANQGNPGAQCALGELYEKGLGVSKDINKAICWYEKVVAQGSLESITIKPVLDSLKSLNAKMNISISAEFKQEKKIALIIGNADYNSGNRLANPVNDALDLAKRLTKLGFKTILRTNLQSVNDMKSSISNFCNEAEGYDIALFYYAGHAIQKDGENFLKPTNVGKIYNKADIEDKYVRLPWIIRSMQDANIKSNIVILDACRDKPEYATRGDDDRLFQMTDPPSGFFWAFATQSGKKAQDGTGMRNSPYMTALLGELDVPGQEIENIFINVRKKVRDLTSKTDELQSPIYVANLKVEGLVLNANGN